MSDGGGKHLHLELSAESRAGWERFAHQHAVTMAATAEAIGLVLSAEPGLPDPLYAEIVSIARQVTAERRSRRPSSD